MASTIRLKTKIRDDVTTVRAIIRHPMETGFRIDDERYKYWLSVGAKPSARVEKIVTVSRSSSS